MKSKQIFPIIIVSILFILAYTSCRKDTTTSTTANSTLGIQIQAVNKSVQLPVQGSVMRNASLTPGASVTWDTASLWVSTLKFEAEMKAKLMAGNMMNEDEHHRGFSRDSIKITFTWHGPQKINLFDVNTVFGGFSLAPGMYDEEELAVAGLRGDAGSDTIFYLSGTYTTSDLQVRRIRIPVKESVLFKTEQDSVEVTGTGVDLVGVVQIYLDKLMSGVPVSSLDNATLQSNGDILISRNSNPDLYYIILHNLRLQHPFHHRWGHFGH
jgi:hypothetical protein